MKLTETDFNFAARIASAALLTAADKNGLVNTMTVSWGGSGILWGKEVCFVFVRPERYTYEFCENGENMSLSFFGKDKKDVLSFCGTKSGRDVDKFEACGLKYTIKNGACVLEDSRITLVLKKLYAQNMTCDCFTDTSPLSNYKAGDFHRIYTCEITDVLEKI